MIVGAYSNRIYKNSIDNNLSNILIDCNDVKIKIYSKIVNNKLNIDKLNTTYVIDNYHINTYYANMIIKKVKETLKANSELQDLYMEDITSNIEEQITKIDNLKSKIDYWKNMKLEILDFIKTNNYKLIFPYKFDNKLIFYQNKTYSINEFETYTNNRIRRLKRTLYFAKNKLDKLNQNLNKIKTKAPVTCFGSKSLFKKQYTVDKYIEDHDLWLNEFRHKRHNNFVISGCKDQLNGSMCVRYDGSNLSIMSHKQGIIEKDKKYAKSEWFSISCTFKYKEKEYLETLHKNETIAYQVIDKGDYFIICASFDYVSPNHINDFISNGINSLDINIDRYAITELDASGNLLKRKVFYFDLDNLTSEQAAKKLEKVAIECFEFCKANNKPLVREDIKKIKFKNTNDKETNKKLTQFAYDKMINTIDRCFNKNDIKVFKTNPCFTSQQGKLKYMSRFGLSIHESAAMCIGRRFLLSDYDDNGKVKKLYYEDMLQYKEFGSIKKVSKAMKKLKTDTIYRLNKIPIKIKDYKTIDKYVKAVNDYIYNN